MTCIRKVVTARNNMQNIVRYDVIILKYHKYFRKKREQGKMNRTYYKFYFCKGSQLKDGLLCKATL